MYGWGVSFGVERSLRFLQTPSQKTNPSFCVCDMQYYVTALAKKTSSSGIFTVQWNKPSHFLLSNQENVLKTAHKSFSVFVTFLQIHLGQEVTGVDRVSALALALAPRCRSHGQKQKKLNFGSVAAVKMEESKWCDGLWWKLQSFLLRVLLQNNPKHKGNPTARSVSKLKMPRLNIGAVKCGRAAWSEHFEPDSVKPCSQKVTRITRIKVWPQKVNPMFNVKAPRSGRAVFAVDKRGVPSF